MRNLLSTALLLAATLSASAQNDLKSVLSQLDATLAHRDSYIAGREQRIESLKNILRKSDFSDAQRYILNQQLIDEYTPYQADSTIDYLYRNIALATRMNDAGHLNESRIQLAYLYSSAGIYLEAANMLKLVDTTALDRRQLVDYYIARHKLNDELQLYSHDSAQGHESWRLTEIYARLIVDNTEPESPTHLNFRLRQAIGARDYPQAVEISERLCSTLQPLSREYAEASYMRALVADLMDDTPTAQVWFARSAMTDIQLAIRDNAALKSLANTLLDDDNIQRAMRYMRIVMDDARFFNSRLRPWQDALALHVIEEAYRVRRQRMDTMYNIFVLSIAGFMLLAVGGVIFVLRQNRKLSLARLELQQANNRLNISNKDLQHINKRLAGLNSQISEANEVKEEYIGIFLTMCSEYIDKIIDSRRHVRRLLRDGRVDELRKEYSPDRRRQPRTGRVLPQLRHDVPATLPHVHRGFQLPAGQGGAHRTEKGRTADDRTAHLRADPAGHQRLVENRRAAALLREHDLQLPVENQGAHARLARRFRGADQDHRSFQPAAPLTGSGGRAVTVIPERTKQDREFLRGPFPYVKRRRDSSVRFPLLKANSRRIFIARQPLRRFAIAGLFRSLPMNRPCGAVSGRQKRPRRKSSVFYNSGSLFPPGVPDGTRTLLGLLLGLSGRGNLGLRHRSGGLGLDDTLLKRLGVLRNLRNCCRRPDHGPWPA